MSKNEIEKILKEADTASLKDAMDVAFDEICTVISSGASDNTIKCYFKTYNLLTEEIEIREGN